jgi:aminoglycoside 6'-N-acetyltransferase
MGDVRFEHEDLAVRLIDEFDLPLLSRWRSDPRLAEWYGGRDRDYGVEAIRPKYLAAEDGVTRCLVLAGGDPVGAVQFYPLEDDERTEYGFGPGEPAWGIDVFLAPASWGKGIGPRLVRATTGYLMAERGASRVTLDPHVDNDRAIRCYEKAGFRRIRLLPAHDYEEGALRDSWLYGFP